MESQRDRDLKELRDSRGLKERNEKILKLWAEGVTSANIAIRCHCSRDTISRVVKPGMNGKRFYGPDLESGRTKHAAKKKNLDDLAGDRKQAFG